MPLRLLVPIDGSARSEQALLGALELAAATPAEVYLLRVVPPAASVARANPAFDPHAWDEGGRGTTASTPPPIVEIETKTQATAREQAEAEAYLAAMAKRFVTATVQCEVRVAEHAAEEIVRFADECRPHVIVLPGHGRRHLTRAFLSSTTERVVRAGRYPVALVPPRE
jgi:nucleotide-binding universal stress UspA family protein